VARLAYTFVVALDFKRPRQPEGVADESGSVTLPETGGGTGTGILTPSMGIPGQPVYRRRGRDLGRLKPVGICNH